MPTKRWEKQAYHEKLGELKAEAKINKKKSLKDQLIDALKELAKSPSFDPVEAALYAGLAVLSLQTFGTYEEAVPNQPPASYEGSEGGGGVGYEPTTVKKTNYFAALIGPVGLKLALSDNIVSGSTGCAILAALGIASIPNLGKTAVGASDAVASSIEKWADSLVSSWGL